MSWCVKWWTAGAVGFACSGDRLSEQTEGPAEVAPAQVSTKHEPLRTVRAWPKEVPANVQDEDLEMSPSGLMYHDFRVGEGPGPRPGERVRVHYSGWLRNGKRFDTSPHRGFITEIGVGRVIRGWDEGIGSMNVGGRRQLLIPPHLAYGDAGRGRAIPPRSTLIFEIELVEILP